MKVNEKIVPLIPADCKCEITTLHAAALRDRSATLMAERLEVRAWFDNGTNSGEVIVQGLSTRDARLIAVKIPGKSEVHAVLPSYLSVDEATAAYLDKCHNYSLVYRGLGTTGIRTRYTHGNYRVTAGGR